VRTGICDFNSDPGLVWDRPRGINFFRSPASRRSMVAALILTSSSASSSDRSSSPSRRRGGTRVSSIGARRLPAGIRSTAQHLISAIMIRGPYVGPRGALALTTVNLNAPRNAARA